MRREHRSAWLSLVASLLLVLPVTFLAGCGSEGSGGAPALIEPTPTPGPIDPGPQPGQGSVVLEAPVPATITAGASGSVVQATVRDADGAVVSGQAVTFTVSPSTVAQLSSATAITNTSGIAQVTVTGLKAGSASVTARAGSVTSSAVTLAVLAPQFSIQTGAASVAASSPGSGGTTVTATLRDHQGNPITGASVQFNSNLGQLTNVTSPADGEYRVTVTSTTAGTALVFASTLGATSDSVQVTVTAGPVDTLTVTPSPSQIPPDGTTESTLTVRARDEFGNAVSGAVDFATSLGILSETSATLVSGQAQVTLTSTAVGTAAITATMSEPPALVATTEVVVVVNLAGEPANILFDVVPSVLTVAGVGGNEVATITVNVVDKDGNPIDDSGVQNNLEVEILDAPGAGENLNGRLLGETLLLSTVGGIATASFQSGTLPGTARVSVRVTKSKSGTPLVPPLTAVLPQITIEAGPPFSVFLGRSTVLQNPQDGTYIHDYFALVSDRYGNAVPDGTAVFFGQFVNILAIGDDGETTSGGTLFESVLDGSFVTNGVSTGDTLAILSGSKQGGFIVSNVSSDAALSTYSTFDLSENGLSYAVGNNGGVGGTVITPRGEAATVGGKATWPNRYSVEIINEPVIIYAETEGRTLGDARLFSFAFLRSGAVDIQGPDEGLPGDRLDFRLFVEDGGSTPITIPDLPIDLSVNIAASSVGVGDGDFNGTGENAVTVLTETFDSPRRGQAEFYWTVPTGAAPGKQYTITVRPVDAGIAPITHVVTVL